MSTAAGLRAQDRITRDAIRSVYPAIQPFIRRTPVVTVPGAQLGLGPFTLTLKLELFQVAGSFKPRGAFTNLLTRTVPPAGIVAASGGNHGAAVAYAAKQTGHKARIYVPTVSSPAKIARIKSYGADLVITGDRYADALAASEAWRQESGAMAIHAYDAVETITGQGTLALELEEQVGNIDTALIAIGGGGLIAGAAAWFRGARAVVGVEPRKAPTMARAFEAGEPVDAPAEGVAADSLGPRRVGELTFAIARAWVRNVVLVEDDDIRAAQRALWEQFRIVAEPGGATAFAALLAGAYRPQPGEHVAVVVCGGNTDAVDWKSEG